MNKKTKVLVGIGIFIFYFLSLVMECYRVDGEVSIASFGLVALVLGWMNFNEIGLVWLANPLFMSSLVLYFFSKKTLFPLLISLIAMALALSFLQVDVIIKDEAGNTGKITGYLLGYWLWVLAQVALFGVLLMNKILGSKS